MKISGFLSRVLSSKLRHGCLLLAVLSGIWLAGCGYTTRSSLIASKFKTIYIVPFVNTIDITRDTDTANKYKINKPALETSVTKEVINRYLFDGNLRPVREENADVVLRGELVEFRREPLRYTESEEVEEYRLNLVVNIKLWNTKTNELEWEESNFTGTATYFTVGAFAKPESSAIADALKDLARRIVERTVEDW